MMIIIIMLASQQPNNDSASGSSSHLRVTRKQCITMVLFGGRKTLRCFWAGNVQKHNHTQSQ